jgi:methylmalonyl-CoA/ethylmalonyl-CoA epimerase
MGVIMRLNRIHQIAMYARDITEAVAFYRDTLGARLIASFNPPGLAFFDYSGVRLLLEKGGPKSTIYFWVDDIDAAFGELRSRGVTFMQEPQLVHRDDAGDFGPRGGEEWMAFFSDPSGNVLALATRRTKP